MSASNYNEKDLVPSAIFEEISNALSIVEKQLILTSLDLKENPKNFRNRILQIGKQVSTKNYALDKQISALLQTENLDSNSVKETLQSMKKTLEGQYTITTENEQQINELTDIAFNQNSNVDQLREALKKSLALNQKIGISDHQITPNPSNAEPVIAIQQNNVNNAPALNYLHSENIMDVKRKEDTQNYNKNQTKLPLLVQMSKPLYGDLDVDGDDVFDDEFSLFSSESQNSRITDLENRVRSLNKQNNDLKNQIKVQKAAYQDLQEKSKQSIKLYNEMKAKIDTLISEKEKLERTLNVAKKKIAQLRKEDEVDYKKLYESISATVKESKSYKNQNEENIVPTIQKVFSEYDNLFQHHTESTNAFKQIQALLSIKNEDNSANKTQPTQANGQLLRRIVERVKEITTENKKLKDKAKLSISNSILRYHSDDLEIQKIDKERNEVQSILQTLEASNSGENGQEGGQDIGSRLKNLIAMRDKLQKEITKREVELKKLKSQRNTLENTIKSIISVVNPKIAYNPTDSSCNPPKDLLKSINNLVNERNQYQAEKEELLEVQIQVQTEKDLLTLDKKKSIDKLTELAKFVDQGPNLNGDESEADLINSLVNQFQTLNELLPSSSGDPNEPISQRLKNLLKEYYQNQKQLQEGSPQKVLSDLAESLNIKLDPNQDVSQLKSSLQSQLSKKAEQKQSTEIQDVLNKYQDNKFIKQMQSESNNGEFNLADAFNKLCNEYASLESKYEQEEKSNKESRQKLNEILGFSPSENVTDEEIQNRVSKIANEHSSILNMLGIKELPEGSDQNTESTINSGPGSITEQVQKLYEENKRLNELLNPSGSTDDVFHLLDQTRLATMNNELNEGLKKLNIDIENLPEGETINTVLLKGLERIQNDQKEMEGQLSTVLQEKEDLNKTVQRIKSIMKGVSPDFDENAPLNPAQLDQMISELKILVAAKEQLEAEEKVVKESKEQTQRMSEIKSILSNYKNDNPDDDSLISDEEVNLVDQIRELVKEKEKLKQSKKEILKILKIEGDATDDQILDRANSIANKQEHDESVIELARIFNITNDKNEPDSELLRNILAKVKSNPTISERSINLNPSEDDEFAESNPESIQALKKENQRLKEENQKSSETLRSIHSMIYPDKQGNSSDKSNDAIISDIQKKFGITPKGKSSKPKNSSTQDGQNEDDENYENNENGENDEENQFLNDDSSNLSNKPMNIFQENKLLKAKLEKAEAEIKSLNEKVIENQSRVSGILEERESVSMLIKDLTQTIKNKMSNGQDEQFEDSAVFQKLSDISNALSEQNAMLTSLKEEKKSKGRNSTKGSIVDDDDDNNDDEENENKSHFNNTDSTFASRTDQNIDRIMTILDISPIQVNPNSSPDEIRCDKTSNIVAKVRQLKGRNSVINSDPYGFPELNQSTSDMYNSIMANDQSEQSFVEEEEEGGDSNDPPTYSRDRSNQGQMMMPSRGIQEILNKKNETINNQMEAFRRMASSLRINPDQYVNNDSQLIEEVVNHVRRLTGDNDIHEISDEPASFSSEPLTQSDQPYTPRRHSEEEETNQQNQPNKPFKLEKLNLKGIPHINEGEVENQSQSRRPQLARLDLNNFDQVSNDQSQQSDYGNVRLEINDPIKNVEEEEEENNEAENRKNKQKNSKHRKKINDEFLIQKLNDISSDLSEQQKILKQMEANHKSTTQIKSLERSLADQQGHWNDLRRALGIPEVEATKNEEEDVSDIQIRMLDKIKQLSALHEQPESDQLLSTPRSTNSETTPQTDLENSQIKELTNLLTIANNTIQTYKDEKDKILKILESEKQTPLEQTNLPVDSIELEPLSEKLDELKSHITANIDEILNARDKLGQSETDDSSLASLIANQNESGNNNNNENTLAALNDNSQMSPIKGPKSPITEAFNQLKEELNQLTIENGKKDKEISNLSTKVNGLNTIIIELKDKNNQMITENKSLLQTKEIQTNENENEKVNNDDENEAIQEEEILSDLGFVSNLKEEVDRLKALIDSTTCSINELNEKRSEIMKSQPIFDNSKSNENLNENANENLSDNSTNKQSKDVDQEINSQDSLSNIFASLGKDSSAPVNEVLGNLRSQMNNLKKSNSEKDRIIKDLEKRNKELIRILIQNGIDPELASNNNNNNFNGSSNSDNEQEGSSLSHQVQMMNKELAAQCDEIEKLKALLDQVKKDLQAMKDERDSIMKSLFPDMESYNDEDNGSQLLSNLTDLDNQVSQQTDEIKNSTDFQNNNENNNLNISIPSQRHRRNIQKSPRTQITDAFNQLKSQIVQLTEKNNELETKLSEAEATIEHLRTEREMFLHGLGTDNLNENNDASKELFRKLNFLDSQIATQNAEIGDAINTSKMDNEMGSFSSSPVPSPKSSRHNRGVLSIRAQTNAQFASTLDEMNQKMKELTRDNVDKDCKISELEEKIEELENGGVDEVQKKIIRKLKDERLKLFDELGLSTSDINENELSPLLQKINQMKERIKFLENQLGPKIQTRHIELNLNNNNDNDNENKKSLNKDVRRLSSALDKTDIEVDVDISVHDEDKSQETIKDLRDQIEALTKARESIANLLGEVSRRAKNLVQQISTLKASEKGKNKTKSLSQWQELEKSAIDFNAKIQSSTAEFNLNSSEETEKVSVEVQTEKNSENENEEDDDDKDSKINELKKQVQRLTETKNSISKLFKEVSKNSKHLIKEINQLRNQPNGSQIEESLNKLETTAEDIASHQSKAEAIINSSSNELTDDYDNEVATKRNISLDKKDLENKLNIALDENKKLKEQLNDAHLKLDAVKESEIVISELAYFNKDENTESKPPNNNNKNNNNNDDDDDGLLEDDDDEEIDKSKQIELLQQKIENLTKARESITKLFMEVSRQARTLVEEIKVLKKNGHSSSNDHSHELDSIENSAHTIAKSHEKEKENEEKVQTLENELLIAQKKINELTSKLSNNINNNSSNNNSSELGGRGKAKDGLISSMRSPINIQLETLRKELVVSDINSTSITNSQDDEDDSKKVRRLQKQVESLQKARASMTVLFNEVSQRSKLLVKQMEEFKNQKKDKKEKKEESPQKKQRVEKLETEIKDLYEAQNAIQNAIESENQRTEKINSNLKLVPRSTSTSTPSSSSLSNATELLKKQNSILTEKINKLEKSLQMAENRHDEIARKLDQNEKKLALIEESDPDVSNLIKVFAALVENDDVDIEAESIAPKEDAASLQEKLGNLQEARQSIGNLTNSLAQSAQSLSKSISALKSKNPTSREISVLEMNANALNSSLNREAKLSELTKKTAEYQQRIAELESMIHNNKTTTNHQHRTPHNNNNGDSYDDYDDFNENYQTAVSTKKANINQANNDENNLEQLQNQISQIEAVLNDEDVISEYPLVQELITRLTQANKNGNRKRYSPPVSPSSVFSPTSTSDSILKQLKAARIENENLKKQLANVSEFANERDDIDSILHGEIDNVDTKSSPLVRSIMQLYNIAHEPITEIQGAEELKKELFSLKEERHAIESILSGKPASSAKENNIDQNEDEVTESTLVKQIKALVKNNNNNNNLSISGNDADSLKAQIFELNKQNELKRLELSQISAILNGNDDINGNNFDLNASLDENVVQRLRDTLMSYKNDSRDKLIKENNSLKSLLDKSSNAQLLSNLKHQLAELEEQNNELTENLNKLNKEKSSILAVVNGKPPTIRTQLVEQVLAFIQNNTEDPSAFIISPSKKNSTNNTTTTTNNNNNAAAISNSSLMQQVNEMNNDNLSSTFNLKGIHISSSNSSLNDELTDSNRDEADSISSIRGSDQNGPNVNINIKALTTENETLRQKLSETKELVNVYAHQFSKIEKFLKLKQVGTIAQRAKAIALKINEERKNLQVFEEQNKKLNAKYQKAKKKVIQLQQNQNILNDNNTFSQSDAVNEEKMKSNNNQ